jgi:hypothetical protein
MVCGKQAISAKVDHLAGQLIQRCGRGVIEAFRTLMKEDILALAPATLHRLHALWTRGCETRTNPAKYSGKRLREHRTAS